MRWISIVFLFFLFSCGPQKAPTRTEVVFECERDTLRIYAVEYVHDPRAVDSLKQENHLLRVEIDRLKLERKQMKKSMNLLLKIKKIQTEVNGIKKEIEE